MNTKLSILFFVKRTKTNTDGLLPIFIRVTVNGERIEFSTKRFTSSDKWSLESNRMKGTSAESKATNSFLDTLKAKIFNYQQQLIREDNLVNAENMRNKILGVEKRSHMLVGIFKQHNEEMKALVGREFATATYTRYETSLKHTAEFLQYKYKVSDIDIRKIDHELVTNYELYLKSVHKCNQNTTAKYIENFGKIVRRCLANGWSYKLLAGWSVSGVFSDLELTQVYVYDIHYLKNIKNNFSSCVLIGDKGYLSTEYQPNLFTSTQIRLEVPMRVNQHEYQKQPYLLRKTRKRIETLFSQLCDQFFNSSRLR